MAEPESGERLVIVRRFRDQPNVEGYEAVVSVFELREGNFEFERTEASRSCSSPQSCTGGQLADLLLNRGRHLLLRCRGEGRVVVPGEVRTFSSSWLNDAATGDLIAMTVFYSAAAPGPGEFWRCDLLAPKRVAARRRVVQDFLEHGLFKQMARTR